MRLRLLTDLVLPYLAGALEALLLARLVLRLFAARPDHPVVAAILALTAPLIAPFGMLDINQPRFGAVLEFSTLVLCVLLPAIWLIAIRLSRPVQALHNQH